MDNDSLKITYGDFQTPFLFAQDVCRLLYKKGVAPSTIVEPTCGIGNFIKDACSVFGDATDIIGYEINDEYVAEAQKRASYTSKIKLHCQDFFSLNWQEELAR